MSKLKFSSDEAKVTPLWRRIWIIVLYMLFFFPSAFALGAVIELVMRMGHGIGMYAGFGHTAGEIAQAWAVLLFYAIWLVVGTIVAVRVFKERLALRWLVIQTIVAWLIILPSNAYYLLALGHM
jgi:hypothetical protein